MRKISGVRTKALRTGMSFVLTFAMALGSVPTDGIAYAAITNGAKTPQVETKVETTETPDTTPASGVVADTTAPATDEAKPKTVKVRFDANGGEGHMDDFEVALNGGDWSVAETPFTRDGYRFVGWSIVADVAKDAVDDPETDIDESLTGVVLADKQEFVDLVSQKRDENDNVVETHDFGKYVSDDALTLYAQWEKVETLEVNAPVVDENAVVKTEENVDEAGSDETIEDTSVVEDDAVDTTSDKELDKELLSGAFGNKTDGGVADKIGTSNPLSRKLMAPLMAAAAPSLTTQSTPEGSRAGTAYAVLDSAGTLTFFRSTNTYSAGTGKTVKDVMGKTYMGQVYTGIETYTGSSALWYSRRTSIKLAKIANGQVIAPKSCAGWFYYCSNMTAFEGADRLDTSAVTSMYYMFNGCSAMTVPPAVGNWNTSAVTNMNGMFYNCSAMTEPPAVGNWNTSKVTNMINIFTNCKKMTAPPSVGNWNTSKVTNMSYMFQSCSAMTEPPAVGSWDTSAVTSMSGMFYGCSAMTVPPAVGSWNTSAVTDMSSMFCSCSKMTKPPAVGGWDTSAVTDMLQVFYNCSAMTEPPAVGNWSTGAVTDMSHMFQSCSKMTEPPAVGSWNTSAVTSMDYMFDGCNVMTTPPEVGSWNTSKVTNMSYMFERCSKMTEPPAVGNWNTSAVTSMYGMFSFCSKMTSLDVSGWDFSKITSSSGYLELRYCSTLRELKVPVGAKITGLPEHAAQGTYYATWGNVERGITGSTAADMVTTINAGNGAGTWTWEKLDPRAGTAYAVLDDAGTLTLFRSTNTYTAGTGQTVTDIMGNTYTGQVYTGVENTGTRYDSAPWYDQRSSVRLVKIADGQVIAPKSCAGWFYWCSNMTAFESAEQLDTSAVTNMNYMFGSCSKMTLPPAVDDWDTSAVTNMYQMFYYCSAMIEPPAVGSWDTGVVTNMGSMFYGCWSMTEPPAVGSWNTSAVTDMSSIFESCSAMTEPPAVGSWNTSKATNMSYMFSGCSAMTESPAVGSWNTGVVTNMSYMFTSCSKMTSLDVSSWDFSKVTSSSNYLGLQNCSALRELKVPAGAKLAGLPEHAAQGDYAETWGNTERGITGSTAANLVTIVNAGNGAGMWTWEPNPRAGTAYAVLDSAGTLTFFRSGNTYTAGTGQTVTDIMGNTYTGQVYTGVENSGMFSTSAPWYSQRTSVKLVRIADGQVIAPRSCAGWFYQCSSLTAFEGAERLDTSAAASMYYMFYNCKAMTEPPAVGDWDTSAVTNMGFMFYNCSAMAEPPSVGSWNTSNVANMSYVFSYCSKMTEPPAVGDWDTSSVTNMNSMFSYCSSMTEPPSVGDWTINKVTNLSNMFYCCSTMAKPPSLESWNTGAVTSVNAMFYSCSAMAESPAVSGWNTSAMTNMGNMFWNCYKIASLDVSNWDFSKITSESSYLGLQQCLALKELKVPAGAKIANLPEHSAQGDYAETWGNADRGITGSTAANLVTTVNAGNGAGTWTWDLAGYTVNFMVDGSPTAMPAERVKADEDYVVPSCEVTKLHHDFVEWSGSDGNTYHAGDTIPAGTFSAGETLTLTAVFAPHEYGPGEFDGNLQLTVPASINFVVEPDGTLTGPSNASIVNNSAVNTRVSSVEVKELGNFNFVANAEASDEQNAVELRFGPLSDMLDAASFLSKSGVTDSAWAMGTSAGQNTVQLETEGKVAHVGADIAKVNKFGEIRWYVKAGE